MRFKFWMLAVLAIPLWSVEVSAQPYWENHVATQCVEWQGNWSWGTWSSIVNYSTTTTLGVDCPAIGHNYGVAVYGQVDVLDRSTTAAVDCELKVAYTSGPNIYASGSGVVSSTTNTDWQKLSLGPVTGGTWPYKWVFFVCSIPPHGTAPSGLASYQTNGA